MFNNWEMYFHFEINNFNTVSSNIMAQLLYNNNSFLKNTYSKPASFPGSLSYPSKDPGWVWSHVSQNLGDYKQTTWGRGG